MNEIAGFCRRVGISVNAGINLLDAVKRETKRQRRPKLWESIVESLEDGNSLAESMRRHEKSFGELFVALIEVGEESGRLGESLTELADYYDQMIEVRRNFLKSLIWPVIELSAAIIIIGILIVALGVIESVTGQRIDPLGFGLVGVSGFVKYVLFLAAVTGAGVFLYHFTKRSVDRSRYVHYLLNRIPGIGSLFRSLALTRLTWAMHLTMRTGMEIKRALTLSFKAANYAPISDRLPTVLSTIDNGGSLTDAFMDENCFDADMISCIDSGEQSGTVPELMHRISEQYLQESLLKLKTLSVAGGFLVYGCIAAVIIFMIFRFAMFYIGILNDAAAGI